MAARSPLAPAAPSRHSCRALALLPSSGQACCHSDVAAHNRLQAAVACGAGDTAAQAVGTLEYQKLNSNHYSSALTRQKEHVGDAQQLQPVLLTCVACNTSPHVNCPVEQCNQATASTQPHPPKSCSPQLPCRWLHGAQPASRVWLQGCRLCCPKVQSSAVLLLAFKGCPVRQK